MEHPEPTIWPDTPRPSGIRGHGKVTSMYSISTTVYEDGCTYNRLSHLDRETRRWVTEDLGQDDGESPTRTASLERIAHAVLDVLLAEGSEAG